MIVLYVILGIVILVLLLAAVVSKDMNYEKSISIDAGINDVWKNVSS